MKTLNNNKKNSATEKRSNPFIDHKKFFKQQKIVTFESVANVER